jgi:hypothetical protein
VNEFHQIKSLIGSLWIEQPGIAKDIAISSGDNGDLHTLDIYGDHQRFTVSKIQ